MNQLPKMDMSAPETKCCPKFDPQPWQDQTFEWDHLLFARAYTRSIWHIPLNMGQVMTRSMRLIQSAQAQPPDQYLILSRDLSPWKSEHCFMVSRDVPGMEMTTLTGTFYTKVFNGEFRQIPEWMKQMELWAKEKGQSVKTVYAFYTTCPKCAKQYGANYVVLFAQL